jgi:hypothetical protein
VITKWYGLTKKGAKGRWLRYNQTIEVFLKRKKTRDTWIKLAIICGFLAGDGSVRIRKGKHYEICFYPDDLTMARIFQELFYQVYGKRMKIKKEKWLGDCYILRTKFKKACLDLLSLASF